MGRHNYNTTQANLYNRVNNEVLESDWLLAELTYEVDWLIQDQKIKEIL